MNIRSKLFYLTLSFWTILWGIAASPILLTFKPKIISKVGSVWGYVALKLLRYICHISYKIQGEAYIPQNKNFIIASKHSSMWETIFLLYYFRPASFIIKKELLKIPIFGWYLLFLGMIPISRKDGVRAIKKIKKLSKKRLKRSFNVIIFPEGSRSNDSNKVKSGIYSIHKDIPDVEVLPVWHNSINHFGANFGDIMKPGVIQVKIKKPVKFDASYTKNKSEYLKIVQNAISE